ncbi:hypothetical protein ABBQ38_009743 [Trebouxia sp. C0009 RCD-2024]
MLTAGQAAGYGMLGRKSGLSFASSTADIARCSKIRVSLLTTSTTDFVQNESVTHLYGGGDRQQSQAEWQRSDRGGKLRSILPMKKNRGVLPKTGSQLVKRGRRNGDIYSHLSTG